MGWCEVCKPKAKACPVGCAEEIGEGEIIEDYPEDVRGHSCLMLAFPPTSNRPIHIVCAPRDEYAAIISAYVPTLDKWEPGYRTRKVR